MFEGFKNLRTWLKQAWGCSCSCPHSCTSSSQSSLPAPPCYFTWVHTDPTLQQAQGRKRVVLEGHTSSVGALAPTQTHRCLCTLPPEVSPREPESQPPKGNLSMLKQRVWRAMNIPKIWSCLICSKVIRQVYWVRPGACQHLPPGVL